MDGYEAHGGEYDAMHARNDAFIVCYGPGALDDGEYGDDGRYGCLFAGHVGNDADMYGAVVCAGVYDSSGDDVGACYYVLCGDLYDDVFTDE